MKSTNINLSDENHTAKISTAATHSVVLGNKGYSEGSVSWKIKINHCGDTQWMCIGISEKLATFADHQSAKTGFNTRGADYDCNRMTPKHPTLVAGDILFCDLDFNQDSFTIRREGSTPFTTKNSESLGKKVYHIFVELYYLNHSVTLISE